MAQVCGKNIHYCLFQQLNLPLLLLLLQKNPNVAAEIEKIIRDQAAAISKELEGNPSPNEKISNKKEEE